MVPTTNSKHANAIHVQLQVYTFFSAKQKNRYQQQQPETKIDNKKVLKNVWPKKTELLYKMKWFYSAIKVLTIFIFRRRRLALHYL